MFMEHLVSRTPSVLVSILVPGQEGEDLRAVVAPSSESTSTLLANTVSFELSWVS